MCVMTSLSQPVLQDGQTLSNRNLEALELIYLIKHILPEDFLSFNIHDIPIQLSKIQQVSYLSFSMNDLSDSILLMWIS